MIEKTFPLTEQLLTQGFQLTQQLYQQLKEEEALLKIAKSIEKVSVIAAQKQGIVTQLNQFTKQLEKILNTQQLSAASEDMLRYIEIAKDAGFDIVETQRTWLKLLELSKKCRELNERNGACLTLLARHTQRSLNILKGKTNTVNTYSQDGSTETDLSTHALISV